MIATFALLFAASAQPQDGVVAHSPPPQIVAVPSRPAPPVLVVPPNLIATAPAPPVPRIVRPPQRRMDAELYISVNDYPASAVRMGAEGRVGFTLDIAANGRVSGCTITRSSGWSVLDATTCRLMRSRARFTPAVDSNGQPAPGRVADELEWKLPGERG